MIVCNCNGLNERQVNAAVQAGARRWKDVHAHYQCTPQCGKCQCEIVQAITEHGDTETDSMAGLFTAPALAGT